MCALTVFDEEWCGRHVVGGQESLFVEVVENWDRGGRCYVHTLRTWFECYPLQKARDRRELKRRLESHSNEDHLGAVNELSWWVFMRRYGLDLKPIPTATDGPRPDFRISHPQEFCIEVTTLNPSKQQRRRRENEHPESLDHACPWQRLKRKVLDLAGGKPAQIEFAAKQDCPCLVVIFDYSAWSGLGAARSIQFSNNLFGEAREFSCLPVELSAIAYVCRWVDENGRIKISTVQSALYHNPRAERPLDVEIFRGVLPQFGTERGDCDCVREPVVDLSDGGVVLKSDA